MRVPPSGSRPLQKTESSTPSSANGVSKKQFETHVAPANKIANAAAAGAADIMSDVKALAAQLKSGSISKEEASSRFVALVIEKRHDLSAFGSKKRLIEDSVKEIAGDDPLFVSKLNAQLQKLS